MDHAYNIRPRPGLLSITKMEMARTREGETKFILPVNTDVGKPLFRSLVISFVIHSFFDTCIHGIPFSSTKLSTIFLTKNDNNLVKMKLLIKNCYNREFTKISQYVQQRYWNITNVFLKYSYTKNKCRVKLSSFIRFVFN